MNKSTKAVIVVIGILSILAGIYGFFADSEPSVNYGGIFIGIVLLGSVLINQKRLDKS